jgi:hypothetical protein
MAGKSTRIGQLSRAVMRALTRAGIRPSHELGEVLLLKASVLLEKTHTRESFASLAGEYWDLMKAAGEIDESNPAEVAQANAELQQIATPHTPLEVLEDLSRRAGEALAAVVPANLNLGWAAFVFTRDAGGFTAYASNSNRGDMVTMLAEFVAKCRSIN